MAKKGDFTELANAVISDNRQAVVSRCKDGSYTIGQKLEMADGENKISIFLKGALHASDLEGLQNLRDAINIVLDKEQKLLKK